MPTFDVTSPDGRKFRVNAPEGATQDQIIAYAQANMPAAPKSDPDVSGPVQAFDIAAGHALDRAASGLRELVPAPIRSAIDKTGEFLGMAPPPTIDPQQLANNEAEFAKVEKAYPTAAFLGGVAPSAATVNPVGMAVMAGMDPGTMGERAGRAALSYGAGKAGQFVGGKIADALTSRAAGKSAGLASEKAQNAVRDATLREAQAAGYVIPPTQAAPTSPGIVNRVLEGISGKIQTGQAAAIKNQEVTTKLAKQALSLPEDVPLTREAIGTVRSAAGQVYQAVKNFGVVSADDDLRAAMNGVAGEYKALINEFPSQKNAAVDALLSDLNRDQFSSSTIVELVKRLRHDGFKNITNMDPEKVALGRVQVGAQNALEDLLERRLAQAGDEGALEVFRRARQLIAKSYTVEKALEESTGKVVASKIGREFMKGRPLTGELATIGKTAEAFPKAVQNVNSSMPGLSPLDAMFGTGAAVASGNPLPAALPLARPLIRSGLLSSPYQKAMVKSPSYAMPLAERLLASAGENPEAMRRIGGLLGLGGLSAYR